MVGRQVLLRQAWAISVYPAREEAIGSRISAGAYTFSGLRGKRPLRYRRGSERTLISQELPSPAQRAPCKQAGAFPKRCKHPVSARPTRDATDDRQRAAEIGRAHV